MGNTFLIIYHIKQYKSNHTAKGAFLSPFNPFRYINIPFYFKIFFLPKISTIIAINEKISTVSISAKPLSPVFGVGGVAGVNLIVCPASLMLLQPKSSCIAGITLVSVFPLLSQSLTPFVLGIKLV